MHPVLADVLVCGGGVRGGGPWSGSFPVLGRPHAREPKGRVGVEGASARARRTGRGRGPDTGSCASWATADAQTEGTADGDADPADRRSPTGPAHGVTGPRRGL
ncbi:hypothetical protein SY2F82_10690 [Streptomyces sp. Y2F8-2]|nr:hypothetical protein SY2F82_10690 [Streptomyces sp. Y2F8-2]